MKGLLCKDWAILMNSYKKNFLIMVVLYLGMAVCLHMDYLCYALVAVCGVYASSTINFDDPAHRDTYARTLPVTPEQVVGCKYLLGLLLTLFGSVCAAVGISLPANTQMCWKRHSRFWSLPRFPCCCLPSICRFPTNSARCVPAPGCTWSHSLVFSS